MPRPPKSRLYWRAHAPDGPRRAWGDFRDYADVGGRREPLVPAGEKLATTDEATAQVLVARRLAQLEAARRGRAVAGLGPDASLGELAREHLIAKARAGRVTERWLGTAERHLARACEFFGTGRALATITVADVQRWIAWLGAAPGRHGGLAGGTIRHHLHSLSNLYRRAAALGHVPPGLNPVASLIEKPVAARREAQWLEIPSAALLLEAARTVRLVRGDLALPCLYPLLATFLLTGGRRAEVLGLEVEDVSFDRKTVTFRPHEHRRLKTLSAARVVPLWPQLEEILRLFVFDAERPPGRLLFPGRRSAAMIGSFDKALDQVAERAGWKRGEIRCRMFRHTYCAARLQTLDRGAPVSPYTVARELGHGGLRLVDRVYGHLGTVRQRSEVVEYRVEAYAAILGERLERLRERPSGAF